MDGGSFLDFVREGSVAYSQEIGEDLKENVYRAMKILAQGFLAEVGAAPRTDSIPTDAVVRQVQENSMRLLYRLLFIFYAESRGLLDIDNRYYYELSLHKLKADVAERLDRGEPLLSIRYSFGESLKNLFRLINDGSESHRISREEFYIPAYDGGLFDPAKNQFLEEARIGDSFMAQAIDLLARSGQGNEKGFVDYSSLEIRHLGSIYEGLLEYRLRVADQEMAAVKEKGREFWLPLGEVGKRKVLDRAAAGEIYLATDKGERKATGSYYTPDYIVKYIVKNTIEPVIEKKKQEWLGTGRPFADYLLSIKVLDPAMGSGHFLVEATDQLARWLVSAWETARPEEEKQKEVAEQDIHWARREVVRNCIYGVDLNPMAVELAKLSLWLTTVASNKPLSFLDHHLRCGNSLIGAELDRLAVLPGGQAEQTPLWGYVLKSHTDGLLKKYSLMAALPDDNLQMVKWKEEQFRQIKESELSRRLAELADVWLSTYFGNKVTDDDYYELQNHLSPEKFPDWAGLREKEWFTRAQALGREKRFFHWELEFPEAFQGEKPGFDVVVGNPPYDILIRSEQGLNLINYININYRAAEYNPNLFAIFSELAIDLAKKTGFISLIVPSMWLTNSKYTNMRNLLINHTRLLRIIDLQFTVFKEIIPTSVFVATKADSNDDDHVSIGINKNELGKLPEEYSEVLLSKLKSALPDGFNDFISGAQNFLKYCLSSKLDTFYIIYRGIETRDNSKYLSNIKRDDLDQPILNATDVARYCCAWNGLYVRFVPKELKSNADANMYRLPKKVLLRRTGDSLISCVDENGYLATKNIYLLIPKTDMSAEFLCSILNSQLMNRERIRRTRDQGQAFAQLKGTDIASFPIRRISFSTPAPERARLVAELKQLYDGGK
ncbi:MAG TPA: TaqI-like C-terminal specificity domain-containing protein, partial [Methanothrix sp.]|nr:TaqI-like C-terminal specificity domain-containing protein [Methanothrix sp.]